ncbi:hypothetical protein [Limosilactobacillus ingluviei]|uniref:hypothetical protein n=1 Tax=Limosilactobacillus ingluviei TaxID=148604 RepID=UPI000704B85A|nr:hypothetical protein [Limosilactobacillus ingluviei]
MLLKNKIYGRQFKQLWSYRFQSGDKEFPHIYVELIETPAGEFDCWVDGKHCPDTVADLKTVNEKNLSGLAGQPVEILEIRG